MDDQDKDADLDPIAAAFGIGTPTPTFTDLNPVDATNNRESTLVNPSSGEVIQRAVDDVTINELEKEERLEDLHIDAQLEGIHNSAVEAFYAQHRMSQGVDPKFSARNAEVAAQFLKIALDSVSERVDAKYKRQKVRIAKKEVGAPKTVNNNVIIAGNRNEILKSLMNKDKHDDINDIEPDTE